LKRQIKTPQCGQNGNFIEVSKNFNGYNNEMRKKPNSNYADPWWKMSVREQKMKYHDPIINTKSKITSTIHESNLKLLEKKVHESALSDVRKPSAKSEIYIRNNNDNKTTGHIAPVKIVQKNIGSNDNLRISKFTEDGQEALEGYSQVFNELKVNYALQLYHDEIYQKEEKQRILQEKQLYRNQIYTHVNYKSTFTTPTTILKNNDNIYNEMTSRLGGTLAIEDLSKQWLKFAEKSKKQSGDKTSHLTGDAKLSFIDACDRGHVQIVQKLLEFGISPNMIANEEPIFILVCRKVN